MCSMYWNLHADITCPNCGEIERGAELQTHWNGEYGSCLNRYELGQPVKELAGIEAARLPDAGDDFIGSCDACGAFIDFGARIANGAVVEVWPLRYSVGREVTELVTAGR